jgi:hypothetical protein
MRLILALAVTVGCAHEPQRPPLPVVPAPEPPAAGSDPTSLFGSDEVVELELAGPLRRVWRDRKSATRTYFDATLTLPHGDSRRTVPVRVRVKGRTRAAQCEVPPYKLKLEPASVAGTLLAGQRVLRAFTHCRDARRYEQQAVAEYLVYRTLNLLTDWSLRARFVRMTYRDTERDEIETYFAVFTEDVGQLAARTGWQELEIARVSRDSIEPNQAALIGIFNYFIGNTDFSLLRGPPGEECCHNARLIGARDGPYIPIPYDFDAAGVIDAPYADPGPALPIATVRDRHYRGLCLHNNYVAPLLARLTAARSRIEALYRGQEGLDPDRLEETLEYYDEFFELAATPEEVADEILGECR